MWRRHWWGRHSAAKSTTECSNRKFEFRAVIKFLCKEGRAAKEIYDRLCAVYGDCAPSYSTVIVTRWSNEFWRGRESLEDDPMSGRPSDAVNPSVIAAVEKLIKDNRRIKVLDIAKTMQISCGSVETIIHDHLKMSKVSARCRWIWQITIVRDASLHLRSL